MKRRAFVKKSVLTGLAVTLAPDINKATAAVAKSDREFYELRVYELRSGQQQRLVEAYWKDAAIPALNRSGIKSVGVFKELKPDGESKLYVLIPYRDLEDLFLVQDKLQRDLIYLEAGKAYLEAPASTPAYERIESYLLRAFSHWPRVAPPVQKERIFELRRYEHASENAGKKKLEMFNEAGEIDIFKRLGFNPVFFGETLIGEARPNLIYMVTFDDMAAHDSHWKAFGSDPEWKKISALPEYADAKLVSRITSDLLSPLSFSQI